MEKVDESSVTLRKLKITDVSDALKWLGDYDASRFCPWGAFNKRRDAIRYFVVNELLHPWNKAICVSGRIVGAISVTKFEEFDEDKCRAEIGYVVWRKYWRKGVAKWAVMKAAQQVFADWEYLERLEAQVDVRNEASQGVVKKAGFTMEGVLRKYTLLKGEARDIMIFSLLSTDPIPLASTSS